MEAQACNSSTQETDKAGGFQVQGKGGMREERLNGEERDGTSLFRTVREVA